jgi:hypothetical protein
MTIFLVAGFLCDSANAKTREPDASWRLSLGVTVDGVLLHGRRADLDKWVQFMVQREVQSKTLKAIYSGWSEILDLRL